MFAKIGKGAVSNVLNGYNSTVFAYGQTGSGKTFTVTGGAERYGSKMSFCLAKIADSNDSSLAQCLFQMLTACIGVLKDLDIRLLDPSLLGGSRNAVIVSASIDVQLQVNDDEIEDSEIYVHCCSGREYTKYLSRVQEFLLLVHVARPVQCPNGVLHVATS